MLKSMQGIKMRLGCVDISSQFFSFWGQSTCFEFSLGDTVLWEQRTSPSSWVKGGCDIFRVGGSRMGEPVFSLLMMFCR